MRYVISAYSTSALKTVERNIAAAVLAESAIKKKIAPLFSSSDTAKRGPSPDRPKINLVRKVETPHRSFFFTDLPKHNVDGSSRTSKKKTRGSSSSEAAEKEGAVRRA